MREDNSAGDRGSYEWERRVKNEDFYGGVIVTTDNKHPAIIKC